MSPRVPSFVADLEVEAVFQPIVDLLAGEAIGCELLSRSPTSGLSASDLFSRARESGEIWELERKCRAAAFARIAALAASQRPELFFVNVSPDVFEDPRFAEDLLAEELALHGLLPTSVVVEITETHCIADHARFEIVMTDHQRQGFRFAVDDFGSGHSSLITLITCAPRFIKLDMNVVRDIHEHAYRRHLVRSLNAFAASVDARLIAEGVEKWQELEALVRLGVRYAQGFLLAVPAATPNAIEPQVSERLRGMLRQAHGSHSDPEESVDPLIRPALTMNPVEHSVADLNTIFRRNSALDHVVLVEGSKPVGLVTRQDLSARLAGPYGFALHQRRIASSVGKSAPLAVEIGASVTTLARRAMERDAASMYDPVIVLDDDGTVIGTITMKTLIERSIELRVRSAQGANPLTGLPGNRAIQKWITSYASAPKLDIVYADLDRFKEYNDHYGFLMGDEMIRLAARALTRHLIGEQSDARLGHIGGDDFVAVFPSGIDEAALLTTCQEFDREKRTLFEPEHLASGVLPATNRRGSAEQVPLVTTSLAVVRRANIEGPVHPGMFGQLAAMLKDKVKRKTAEERQSTYIVERRFHPRPRRGTPLDGIPTLREAPFAGDED